jgi:hypothetical protein
MLCLAPKMNEEGLGIRERPTLRVPGVARPQFPMALLFGPGDGVYRTPDRHDADDATQVLDAGRVIRVRRLGDGAYACSNTGLHRSRDGGRTWSGLGVPREEVYSVCAGPAGDRLYAGTHPAHLYVSVDDGDRSDQLERAVEQADTLEPSAVRDALFSLDTTTVFGDYRLDERGVQVGKTVPVIGYRRGLRETLWPQDIARGSAS